MIIVFILLSCVFSITYPFSFCRQFQKNKIEFERNVYNDPLWYKHFFDGKETSKSLGRGIVIAILDTELPERKSGARPGHCDLHNLNSFGKSTGNSSVLCTNGEVLAIDQKKQNRLSELMKENRFWRQLMYKNHSNISLQIIQEIAPKVTIMVIPILNEEGCARKYELYQGLLRAKHAQVDIVHLGLQVFDWSQAGTLEQKILQLIQSFSYVVASSGNFGDTIDHVGYPAAISGVISVGSFGKKAQRYPHSDFCQATEYCPVDFVMPGEDIWTMIWVDEINDYLVAPVSGTSFSASFMTGLLACILEKNDHKLSPQHIIELLQICSYKYDSSWDRCIKYGIPLRNELLLHLDQLIGLNKKKCKQYFMKLRNSMSR